MVTPSKPRARRAFALVISLALGPVAGCGSDPPAPAAPPPPVIQLLVDADRNGVAEASPGDRAHRAAWSSAHGAAFLANVDDDDEDHRVDAEDDLVNGENDERDLARVRVAPWARVPRGATGRVTWPEAQRARVRIFRRTAEGWSVATSGDGLTDAELRAGVEFGVEALDFPSPEWDGRLELALAVTDAAGRELGTDAVVLRAAPFVMGNPVGDTERVFASTAGNLPASVSFIRDLRFATEEDEMDFRTIDALDPVYHPDRNEGADIWTQDIMEFGWTAIPGPDGTPHGMYVVLRAPTPNRPATRVTERELLGRDFGYVWKRSLRPLRGSDYDVSLDSLGNLEMTPPYRRGGEDHPLGRVLLGRTDARHGDPVLQQFLEAQRVQAPVISVDTSWLLVGHVDELVSFVRTERSPRGWVLLLASPREARRFMQALVARDATTSNALMFAGRFWYSMDRERRGEPRPAQRTIGSILQDAGVMAINQRAQARIDTLREMLQTELGLADTEIVELPFLFMDGGGGAAVAMMPGIVNLLTYHRTVVMPRPHGAEIGLEDVFERDAAERFVPLGVTARFAEDWDILHAADGEVHCGTNTLRRIPTDTRWWELSR